MDKEQLYVLDVHLNKITFAPHIMDIPSKEDIDVSVNFINFVDMNIRSEHSIATPCTENRCISREDLLLNFGNSQVFFSNAKDLLTALNKSPLELVLTTHWNSEAFGKANLAWTLDFISMVEKSNSLPNDLIPAGIETVQDIISKVSGQVVGQIDMFIRLSCFGHMTFEQFQEIQRQPIAVQPPKLKNIFQPPDDTDTSIVTFLVGLISFTIFITALYLAVK